MDALFEIGAEAFIGEDIDFALQNGFQLHRIQFQNEE
jgi:hypothetical protein